MDLIIGKATASFPAASFDYTRLTFSFSDEKLKFVEMVYLSPEEAERLATLSKRFSVMELRGRVSSPVQFILSDLIQKNPEKKMNYVRVPLMLGEHGEYAFLCQWIRIFLTSENPRADWFNQKIFIHQVLVP